MKRSTCRGILWFGRLLGKLGQLADHALFMILVVFIVGTAVILPAMLVQANTGDMWFIAAIKGVLYITGPIAVLMYTIDKLLYAIERGVEAAVAALKRGAGE